MTRPRCHEGYNPTGTITFTLYAPDGTTVVYTDHVTVSGNGIYSTTSGDNPGGYIPLVAGTYQWVASYSGDGNNNAVSSPKGDEPVIATTASPRSDHKSRFRRASRWTAAARRC